MTRNNDLLMVALSRFFASPNNVNRLLDVLDGKSSVSLRLLDHFVTNYARKHKTTICSFDKTTMVCVHSNYRSQLKAFSKQQFDPFRRRERIIFEVHNNRTIETTVGQLNFFRWAIEAGVLQYVIDNKAIIESDMCKNGNSNEQQMEAPDTKGHNPNKDTAAHASSNIVNQLHVTTLDTPQLITFD